MSRKRQGLKSEVLTAEHTNRRLCLPELMPCSLTGSVSGEPVTSIPNVEKKKLKQNGSSEALLNFYQSARLHIPEDSGLIKHTESKYFSSVCTQ